ncbi:unnamed protein product, partial [Prorocentrum cordatum]
AFGGASSLCRRSEGSPRPVRYTEAWLCLLQQATAEAVREAAAAAEQQQLAARPQADGPPRPRPPWAPAAPPEEHPLASLGSNATGAAACAAAGASGGAHGLAEKVAPAVSRFSVCVPKQYPGVQYRKSKNLSDRYQRYAEHGSVVAGVIEGEWLKLNSKVFLPVRVNGMQILEPLADDASDSKAGGAAHAHLVEGHIQRQSPRIASPCLRAPARYILGAARGNAAEELGRALAAYDSSLAAPGGATNASARRMSAEALLRLGRYEEAFGVFSRLAEAREAAAAWEDPGWGSLEVPPFRLRHDAALCARLASLGRLDAAAAEDSAAAALEEVAGRVEARCGGDCRRYPSRSRRRHGEVALLRRGLFDDLGRSSAGYPAARLAAWSGAGGCPPDPLNASVDWAAVSEDPGRLTWPASSSWWTTSSPRRPWRSSGHTRRTRPASGR